MMLLIDSVAFKELVPIRTTYYKNKKQKNKRGYLYNLYSLVFHFLFFLFLSFCFFFCLFVSFFGSENGPYYGLF